MNGIVQQFQKVMPRPDSYRVCDSIPLSLLLVFLAVLFPMKTGNSAEGKPPLRVMRHIAMAAELEFILYGADATTEPEALLAAGRDAFAAVDALEQRISRWQPSSQTSLINRGAAERPVTVGSDLIEILLRARHFYETTDGVFDVTVGPLLSLWGFYRELSALPDEAVVKQTLQKVGLNHVKLDIKARTVFFERPGMYLDFGGIGKGLALDRAAVVLREQGVQSARLSIGTSTLVALGAPPDAAGWTVDLRSPYNSNDDAHFATVNIRDESLSTSSGAERYVELDGKRYSHILDPRTGMPARSDVISATAIAPTGVESDALSTAFFVMGLEATRAYCKQHPHVRAILLIESGDAPETVYVNISNEMIKEQQ